MEATPVFFFCFLFIYLLFVCLFVRSFIRSFVFFLNKFIILFIYFWLRWVFVAVCGLSLVVASGGSSSLRCMGFSLQWLLLLQNTGSRHAGSVVVARGF